MSKVSDLASSVTQHTGQSMIWSSTKLLNRFQSNIEMDIAGLVGQLNTVYLPLISNLVGESDSRDIDPFALGLSGNTLYSDVEATAGSHKYFFDQATGRKLSIKESIDGLVTAIDTLSVVSSANEWPTNLDYQTLDILQSSIDTTQSDLVQIKKDVFGTNYSLDGDAGANLTYPLSQVIDAIGAFFPGYTSTGLSYSTAYPTLTFAIPLSNITLDTTLPQSSISDLNSNLTNLRTFTGMSTPSSTTTYSTHGAITYVADGDSLEEAIQILDENLADLVSETILYRTAFTDTSFYTLTTNGATPSASNILTVPTHTAVWATVSWVVLYSDGAATQRAAGGTINALCNRLTGSVTVVDYSTTEMTDSAANAGEVGIETAATVAVPKIIASGFSSGGVEFQLALTTGAGTPTKAVARVKLTAVTNTGP